MLLLILFLTMIVLIVVLWGGTYFFQGYIYTEPSPGIFWQAPAAGAFLTFGFLIWTMSVAFSSTATPTNLPINTIFRFSATDDLLPQPAKRITAIKLNKKKSAESKDGEKVVYKLYKDPSKPPYYKSDVSVQSHPWHGQDVIAIEIEIAKDNVMRFDAQPAEPGQPYREFQSSDGWVMREYEDGPTGLPIKSRFSRVILNMFYGAHFVGWFLALWLILRFHWTHALGLAVVLWLVMTLTFLPMMLGYAAEVAVEWRGVRPM
jgi:hypothetical protein